MKNAFIYLAVFIGIQAAVTLITSAVFTALGKGDNQTAMMVISSTVASMITFVVFLLTKWTKVSRSYLQSRPWGVLTWSALVAVGMVIPSTWFQELMPELPNILEAQFAMLLKNEWGYLAVCLLAPLVEEMVFRGAILRSLLGKWKARPWLAIVVSALLFAVIHGNPAQMPHAFLAGLLLGWMFKRTRSIVPGVALHWVNNTISYVCVNVLPHPDAPLIYQFNGSSMRVAEAVVFSFCILLPAIYQLYLRMKPAETDWQEVSGEK